MSYILFLVISFGGPAGNVVTTAEFNSKSACIFAGKDAKKNYQKLDVYSHNIRYWCSRKGRQL